MATLRDQIEWEQECAQRGSERYYAQQKRLRDAGQGDQSDVVSHLLKDRLLAIAAKIEGIVNQKKAGRGAKYNRLLKLVTIDEDYLKIAYMGMTVVFAELMKRDEFKQAPVVNVCLKIGAKLEVDIKCHMFQASKPAYYDTVVKSLKDQNVSNYEHKQKVLMTKFRHFDLEWTELSQFNKTQIGQRVLRCILEEMDDVLLMRVSRRGVKTKYVLDTTDHFDMWMREFEKEKGFMYPYMLPLKIPPRDWESNTMGGYYTPVMSQTLPLVKTRGREARKFVEKQLPQQHMSALNKMQQTAWCINKPVLDVQRAVYEQGLKIGMPSNVPVAIPEFPAHLAELEKGNYTEPQKEEIVAWKALAKAAHGRERERKGKILSYMQSSKTAFDLSTWDEFYFAYNCDFRGRIYCATGGLSPQGADLAKGLLKFKEEVALGESGVRWLAVHGANTWGEDKLSYEDRHEFIRTMETTIQQIVTDPISNRQWGDADKPYQFLAFCFEWALCDYGRDSTAKSSIPIGQDGSCNGLQHFSAMLRDDVGGAATNLIPTTHPSDIYQQVADVCSSKLRAMDDWRAAKILAVGLTRKCAKRPVMTLPYGATQQSARSYVMEWIYDNWPKFKLDEEHQFPLAKFLTPILWESIGEVVVAARSAMSWLRSNAEKDYVSWITPIGFPVYQHYLSAPLIEVYTQLNGGCRLHVWDLDKMKPKRSQQLNGVSPNFVHSIDSTHMVMTINVTDAPAFAMIHDDFGVHAGHSDHLAQKIREAFLKLYTEHDPLNEWAVHMGLENCDLPRGTLAIEDILKADYFFG